MGEVIDTNQEIKKMKDKKQKHNINLQKLNSKLNNSSFLNKAPKNVIDQFKKEVIDIKTSIEKIDKIIDTIH